MARIVAFSHLRWNFVWQRPQQLLSRFARAGWPVLFIEEPELDSSGPPRLERHEACPGVTVIRPRTPIAAPGFHDDQLPLLERLLADDLARCAGAVAWAYTPMALPLIAAMDARAIVYDCMDELALFRNAPRQLTQRESALFRLADLVFTGGRSLYLSKRARHPSVHCFPSSVDAEHYAPAAEPGRLEDPAAQAGLPHPRIGFAGVVDERMDLALVDAVSAARPDWQFVFVGPVVKIDPAALPQRPNVHWLGQRTYEELPAFMAHWDVAILPFARNDATRFISPTKTLEYLAAGRPVVSTSIADVAHDYGHLVQIADDPQEFAAACDRALAEDADMARARVERTQAELTRHSWDATVTAMRGLIDALPPRRAHTDVAAAVLPRRRAVQHVILGAGATGLSAAMELGRSALLVERRPQVGGGCRSTIERGYTFDLGGHVVRAPDPAARALLDRLLGDNVCWQPARAAVHLHGMDVPEPFAESLHGLPAELVRACVVGVLEARFGPLNGVERRRAGARLQEARAPGNTQDLVRSVWGTGIGGQVLQPWLEKLWATPLRELDATWPGTPMPLPELSRIVAGALGPADRAAAEANADCVGYPRRGGMQAVVDAFLPQLEAELMLDAEVVAVSAADRSITLADGRVIGWSRLVSTLPLPTLVAMLGDEAPPPVRAAALSLRWASLRVIHLGVVGEPATDRHWIRYPGDEVFHRAVLPGNLSPATQPEGCFGLTLEISHSSLRPLPVDGHALTERAIADARRVGLLQPHHRIDVSLHDERPVAFPLHDHARTRHVQTIARWLEAQDIVLAGSLGEWEQIEPDQAFVAGRRAAAAVRGTPEAADGHASSRLGTRVDGLG